MTTQENPSRKAADPLQLAQELGDAIDNINTLFAFRKLMRRLVVAFAISLLLDITISIVLAVYFNKACQIGNETRAEQIRLWDGVVAHFSPPHPTVAQHLQQVRFLRFVHDTFR